MCTTCINTNLRVPQTARRLTINFERNSQIVTLSETDVSATLTFTATFAIYDTLVKRPPGILVRKRVGGGLGTALCLVDAQEANHPESPGF